MIPNYLSALWLPLATAVGNHLWQSTLFGLAVGILSLILRKNHARARYALWLAASVKFLIPFSLLVILGTHLARPRSAAATQTGFNFAMEQVSQPFTPATGQVISLVAHSTLPPKPPQLIPAILVALWFCGFVWVLLLWYAPWRRISAIMREAVPLREGREVQALRRVERQGRIRKPIDFLLSPATLEPGIFGIVRPILLWPREISERLNDRQLEAVLVHEMCHVRRRDNLTSAVHMVVEALFWFHPLVWWLGVRLMEERERACDEEVLESGSERQVYAESILRTCEFCVESPLTCVAGVTGADLKKRIVRIMTERVASKLSLRRKLLLAGVGIAVVAGPIVFGLVNVPATRADTAAENALPLPSFEVATVKLNHTGELGSYINDELPGRFQARNTTIKFLVEYAYHLPPSQISGGPDWFDNQRYDVEAKIADVQWGKLEKLRRKQRAEQIALMLRSLFNDRCHLTAHHQIKETKIYALVVAKNGPKLYPAGTFSNPNSPANPYRDEKHHSWSLFMPGGTTWQLAQMLSSLVGRPVVDETGLTGKYDLALDRTPDLSGAPSVAYTEEGTNANPAGPSIFTLIQEQLGLRLESTKGPVDVLVIDHIDRPSEN